MGAVMIYACRNVAYCWEVGWGCVVGATVLVLGEGGSVISVSVVAGGAAVVVVVVVGG